MRHGPCGVGAVLVKVVRRAIGGKSTLQHVDAGAPQEVSGGTK